MTDTAAVAHEGSWVDVRSRSGQDDTAYIACSCGWRSRAIWSRTSLPAIQQAFAQHCALLLP